MSTDGASLIAAERRRQVEAEGWTPEHDAHHADAELLDAAESYVWAARYCTCGDGSVQPVGLPVPISWPWDTEWWKPSDDVFRNLVRAGALIAAEIDRLAAALPSDPEGVKG